MSAGLESLLGAERRAECDRNDKALSTWHLKMAAAIAAEHPITPVAPIRAKGNHLVAAQDEPEPDLLGEASTPRVRWCVRDAGAIPGCDRCDGMCDKAAVVDRGPLTVPAEITEADWIAADLTRNERKAERWHQRNDAAARVLDLQHLDAIRGAGL